MLFDSATAELERQYFVRGKEVLGSKAGGLLARLLKMSGSVALARSTLERASTKQDPREYLAKVARPKAAGAVGNGYAEDWQRKAAALTNERAKQKRPTAEQRTAVAQAFAAYRAAPVPPEPRKSGTEPATTDYGARVAADLDRRKQEPRP